MKALALNLFLKILRMVGYKTVLRFSWRKVIYPKLKSFVERSEEGWDDELLKFVDENIEKVIAAF